LSQVLTTGEILRALASTNSALNLTVSGVLNDGPLASTATYIADNAITSAKIADGAIINADINASAAIDKTKISGTAVTVADTGTVTSTMILDGTILNADINASAAIDQSKIANLTSDLALKAPLASPTLTGTPLAPTANSTTNNTQIATTAFANAAGGLVYISSGTFTNVATADITGFSSTYNTYKLDLSYNAAAITTVYAQLYSGATVRNTGYYGGMWYVGYLGSSGVFSNTSNGSSFYIGDGNTAGNPSNLLEATIAGIANLKFAITGSIMDMKNTASITFAYTNFSNPSSFDKIRLIGTSANISGSWTLMGVRT
jgi:hypothetical protein